MPVRLRMSDFYSNFAAVFECIYIIITRIYD